MTAHRTTRANFEMRSIGGEPGCFCPEIGRLGVALCSEMAHAPIWCAFLGVAQN